MEPQPSSEKPSSSEAGATDKVPQSSTEIEWREYLFFREELRHEDNLINQRVSWLIGSQAFLLGGFASSLSANPGAPLTPLGKLQDFMLIGLPMAGILGVIASYVTLLGAVLHVRGVLHFIGDRFPERMPSLRDWHALQRRMGLFGPLVTPLIFLAFWIVILVRIR
jgi:hypothetical protein